MMTYSLEMAKARALWARGVQKTNEQVAPQKSPEQKLAAITQRIQALETQLFQFSAEVHKKLAELAKPQPAQTDHEPLRPTLSYITRAVAREFGFTEAEVLSMRQDGSIVIPRHIAIYLCLRLTLRSMPTVAKYFRRDHTTIMYARDKIAEQRKTDEHLRAQLAAFEAKLYPEGGGG